MSPPISPVIALESVSKEFSLYPGPLHQMLGYMGLRRGRVSKKLALDSVTLSVNRGERIGIVGHNGSGKTTLLRLIIGHTQVSSGRRTVEGRVQALMQTGYGFNDDLTGLENIRNALVYNGISSAGVAAAEADIIDFVELGEYLHHPIKTYSLGMRARLEFAAATAIHPDVLAIDEVLGAGDGYFMKKCAARMRKLVESTTLLLVSHALDQIQEYCERVIWMDKGKIRADGPTADVLEQYRQHMTTQVEQRLTSQTAAADFSAAANDLRSDDMAQKVRAMFALPAIPPSQIAIGSLAFDNGAHARHLEIGAPLGIEALVRTDRPVRAVVLGLSEHGAFMFELELDAPLPPGKHTLKLESPALGVGVGHYILFFALRDVQTGMTTVIHEKALSLGIAATNWSSPPLVHLDCQWYSGANKQPIKSKISGWV